MMIIIMELSFTSDQGYITGLIYIDLKKPLIPSITQL